MITRPDGTRLAWIAGRLLEAEIVNRALFEYINNVIVVGAEPTGCEALVAQLLRDQVTPSRSTESPRYPNYQAMFDDSKSPRIVGASPELAAPYGVTGSPSHVERCDNTPCARDWGHEGFCSSTRDTESLSDQITKLPFPPRRVEDTTCDEDFIEAKQQSVDAVPDGDRQYHVHCFDLGCTLRADQPSTYEQLADRLTDHVMKKHTEDTVCIAADMASDDGYCGAPEFCDCARFAAQREDRQGFVQDPLSRGAEPGHDMGAGGSYTVVEGPAPSWMNVITLNPRPGAGGYEVKFRDNHVYLGYVFSKEDGYYDFWPDAYNGGYWTSYVMRAIADAVDELNEPWDRQIQNDPALNNP